MRLAGQEKMGYYATPLSQVALMSTWLSTTQETPVRLLDPCCGGGKALEALARALEERGARVTTWGVELSPGRAEEAAGRLDRVLPCAWEHAHVRDEKASLVFLNPPYDYEGLGDSRRQERTFLTSSRETLVAGGVLVYIIPEYVLRRNRDIQRHLAGWYRDVRVWQFTPEEYEAYSQIVLVGERRAEYNHPTKDEMDAIAGIPAPVLETTDEPCYRIPEAPRAPREAFYFTPTTDEDYQRTIAWQGLSVADMVKKEKDDGLFRPVLPFKKGHLSLLLSSGLAGQMMLRGEGGVPLLVRGRVVREITYVPQVEDAPEENDKVFVTQESKPRPTISVASPDDARKIDGQDELRDFIKVHARQMTNLVLANHRPLYDFDAEPHEWRPMEYLAQYHYLPRREEPGLLKAQKHVTVALSRLLRQRGAGILNAEMGWGKTLVAAALPVVAAYVAKVVEKLDENDDDLWPVLVACPPHLVDNWADEIEKMVPLSHVRIIDTVVHQNKEDAERARRSLAKGGRDCSMIQFIEDYRSGKLRKRSFAVISYQMLKLGPGYIPVAVPKRRDGETVLTCPDCGQVVMVDDEEEGEDVPVKRPATWEDLEASPLRCEATVLHRRWDPEREQLVWSEEKCDAPLHSWKKIRRVAGSDLLKRYQDFFGLFVSDEVHMAKGGDTDVGAAFGKAVQYCRRSLALTGTIFGGKSKSLFYILYRMFPEIREEYGYDEADRWSKDFGVRKRTLIMKREDVERGFYSGYRRKKGGAREAPGISPEVLKYLLPYTVFATLPDLGYDLPPYHDEAVVFEMDPAQRRQYDGLDNSIRPRLRDEPKLLATWQNTLLYRPDTAFREEEVVAHITTGYEGRQRQVKEVHLATSNPVVSPGLWLNGHEDGDGSEGGGDDDERIRRWLVQDGDATEWVSTPPGNGDEADIPRLLPKEQWLKDYCRSEVAAGRRVIVYVSLTGERDMQPRLRRILEDAGLRAKVLRSKVRPRKRMKWVRKHKPDVLICNPELVKTGLNLVDYATVIFYQISYSLYTTWQACRRVWRLGQTKPVKVIYTAYADSMQEHAVGLVGKKIGAAQLLFGDEVAGAIVPGEEAEGSFRDELAKAALEDREVDLESIFARENQGTDSPLGSPTARSEALPVFHRSSSLDEVEEIDPDEYEQGALL